jgi:dTDP-4-amino-4,6-dideoxygalactose transaminase
VHVEPADRDARTGRRLHPRLRIDISAADLLFALLSCIPGRRRGTSARVLAAWDGGDEGLACLSLRSAFDLLLEALALEPGDEVALSAVTHPDMARIVAAHSLTPIPVDLDEDTLAPSRAALEGAISPRTKVVVVAHLFGTRVNLDAVAELVRPRGILLVEDCAQGFLGPSDRGDPLADVSLFSFGAIKGATALGGGLARVADAGLRTRMAALQAQRPRQGRLAYALRVLKLAGLVQLGRPRVYWWFARSLRRAGRDLDAVVSGAVRGFPGPDLLPRVRRQPSAPLLALLERRLRRHDGAGLAARAAAGGRLVAALPDGISHPGRAAPRRTHWVLPVLVDDPTALVGALRAAGFDAARATTGIATVPSPASREDLVPATAVSILRRIVFVPAYPALGEGELRRLRAVLRLVGSA